jgi:hypothetical protein
MSQPNQTLNPTANCICRDEPDSWVEKRGLVMRPKLGLPTTFPGWPALVTRSTIVNCYGSARHHRAILVYSFAL